MKFLYIIVFGFIVSVGYCTDEVVTNAPSPNDLIARLEDKNVFCSDDAGKKMIFKLGEFGDKKAIPVLKKYLTKSESRRSETIGGYAQVALAKLGDDNAFNEIAQGAKTNDPIIHRESFIKLGMVGNEKAIKILGQCLFIDEPPLREVPPEKGLDGKTRQDVVKFFPPSYLAAQTLEKIFRDKSPTSKKPRFYDEEDIQRWREWWIASSNKYYNSSSNAVFKAKTP